MSWLSWLSRLRNHLRSNRVSSDIQREMRFHLDERADDLVASGLTREAARREARRKFGSLAYQSENTRASDLFTWLDVLVSDLRYALRSLRATPAFALVAILSLALGIGANTAIFSILNAVMLKSLPVSHPEELVALVRDEDANDVFTNPLWEAIRDRQDMFAGAFAFSDATLNLTKGGEARRVGADFVSGDFFSTLGVHTALGRTIVRADDYRGCPGVAVLSHGFWQTEYTGDPDVVGKTISFGGHPFTIVGVTDARFFGVNVGQRPQVYVPLCADAIVRGANSWLDQRSTWFLQVVARPKAGITPQAIAARFKLLAPGIIEATMPANWPAEAVSNYRKTEFKVIPADKGFSDLRSTYKKALYILMAIVALVLLVACANVANLLLARAAVRQREMAVRLALGASRGRIARQLITESLLLSSLGAALGIAFAVWGGRLLPRMLSRPTSTVALDLSPDAAVLWFTIGIATLTGLLFGLAPAWRSGRVDPQAAMKANGRGVAEGHTRLTLGKTLVVAQVAMSLVLVASAGLLLGSWRRLATVDPGFRRSQVLLVRTDITAAHAAPDQRYALYTQLRDRFHALPGVRNASISDITPVGRSSWNELLRTEGFTPKSLDDGVSWANAVSEGYFATLGTPLLSGRDFDARETPTSAKVAIVNESMARHFFHSPAAVGKHFEFQDGKTWSGPIEVIGVVGDTKYRSLRDSAQPIIYFPRAHKSADREQLTFELQTDGPALALMPAVRSTLAEVDSRYVFELKTLESQLGESMTLVRTTATLSGFFGALALILATIGLYGIMAYSVARRRNEIGVRIALGALQSRVIRMVLGDVGRIVVLGVLLGVGLSFAVTRLVTSFLYGIKPNDPTTLIVSALILVGVGLAAAAIPAFRAARLDPVAALREE